MRTTHSRVRWPSAPRTVISVRSSGISWTSPCCSTTSFETQFGTSWHFLAQKAERRAPCTATHHRQLGNRRQLQARHRRTDIEPGAGRYAVAGSPLCRGAQRRDWKSKPISPMELVEQSFLSINDGVKTLGGNPTGNRNRILLLLRQSVPVEPWGEALPHRCPRRGALNAFYETTGALRTEEVALHNLPDPRVPFWHEILYWWKTLPSQSTNALYRYPRPASRSL